jgi:hypothetical protein
MSVAENDPDPGRTFVIDPEVARSLRDDWERTNQLLSTVNDPDAKEEGTRLLASIKERAGAIPCPASYGRTQQDIDSDLLQKAWLKRLSATPLTEAEDAVEAQARARMLAFDQTPEQLARQRIEELDRIDWFWGRGRRRTAAEQQELDDLRLRYPEPEKDITKDPTYPAILAVEREIARMKKEDEELERLRKEENDEMRNKGCLFAAPHVDRIGAQTLVAGAASGFSATTRRS